MTNDNVFFLFAGLGIPELGEPHKVESNESCQCHSSSQCHCTLKANATPQAPNQHVASRPFKIENRPSLKSKETEMLKKA